jgi:hypothetical protein
MARSAGRRRAERRSNFNLANLPWHGAIAGMCRRRSAPSSAANTLRVPGSGHLGTRHSAVGPAHSSANLGSLVDHAGARAGAALQRSQVSRGLGDQRPNGSALSRFVMLLDAAAALTALGSERRETFGAQPQGLRARQRHRTRTRASSALPKMMLRLTGVSLKHEFKGPNTRNAWPQPVICKRRPSFSDRDATPVRVRDLGVPTRHYWDGKSVRKIQPRFREACGCQNRQRPKRTLRARRRLATIAAWRSSRAYLRPRPQRPIELSGSLPVHQHVNRVRHAWMVHPTSASCYCSNQVCRTFK